MVAVVLIKQIINRNSFMNDHKTPFDRMVIRVLVLLIVIVVLSYCPLYAQNKIKITEPNWNLLLDKERKALSEKFVVEVVSGGSLGVILDAQMLKGTSKNSYF
jgi:hypothetical protein